MANWNVLKAAVANIINANGNQEITGQLLQNVLNNIITNVGENATFAGIATLDTNPGAPDGPVFYLATTVGVYPNFNGLEVLDGEAIIFLWNNSAWTKKVTGFATQEKMQELEENTNEKLSQLGSEYNFEFDTIEKHWYPFDLKKGKTYLFYNDSDDAIYLYAAVSDGGGEYEEIREYGLPSRIWYEYTHNAGNRSYIVVNPRKRGVLKAYTGITKTIKKNEVAAKNDFNKCQAGINSNQDRIKTDCLSEEIKATWCRYTDGALIGSGSYLSCFKVDVTNINKLYVRTYLPDTASAAIAFFSNNNLYLKDSSVQGTDTGLDGVTFTADIPEDAEYAIITSSYNVNTNKPNIYTYDIGAVVGKVQKKIEINEKSISGLLYADIALPKAKKGWIRHGTGEFVDSAATLCYILDATKITKIKAYLKSDVSIIDGISFYSSNVINKDFYLQSSIAWLYEKPLGAWYETDIPKEAKIVCITSNIRDGFQPIVQLLQIEMNNLQDEKIAMLIEQNKELTGIAKIKGIGDIYHYGMLAVAMREEINTIPSQSIFDVRHAAKLGFKCIEANLHKTSDGKYVVTHGVDGGLGHDFSDLFGNDAFGVKIGEYTLEELKSNYVYYTDKEEYAIPITTLEEFCSEAKKCGLMVMLQYSDTESISIAEGILGRDNIFMYHAPREQYDGVILDYLYYDTKSEIIHHCESMGKPFIYSMDNPSKFDDETLKEICKELHLKGYYIASAYCGKELQNKLKGFGFDFFAIGGVAKELKENQTIIGEKVVTFNADGSVTWGKYN